MYKKTKITLSSYDSRKQPYLCKKFADYEENRFNHTGRGTDNEQYLVRHQEKFLLAETDG